MAELPRYLFRSTNVHVYFCGIRTVKRVGSAFTYVRGLFRDQNAWSRCWWFCLDEKLIFHRLVASSEFQEMAKKS